MNNVTNLNVNVTDLKKVVYSRLLMGLVVIGLILFGPAGSFRYWEAWVYYGVIFLPMCFIAGYFLKNDPELLQRRMQMKEKQSEQKAIIKLSGLVIFLGFLIPGLDFRYQWSEVPTVLAIVGNLLVFVGYLTFFFVLKENSYASRIVEVAQGQKVISTGPYALVRHPMYTGVILMFLFTPLALGSYWALIPFAPMPVFMIFRIFKEEEFLQRELPGYTEYCEKTRYRLLPFIW